MCKFHGSRAIVGLVGLVPSWHRAFVGISWVQNFFSWVFRGSKIFSRGYFVEPKFFVVGILWLWNFLSWVFRGSKVFWWVFVGPKFSLKGISWIRIVFSWVFRGPIFFSCSWFPDSKIQGVAGCIGKSDKNSNTKIYLKPRILF